MESLGVNGEFESGKITHCMARSFKKRFQDHWVRPVPKNNQHCNGSGRILDFFDDLKLNSKICLNIKCGLENAQVRGKAAVIESSYNVVGKTKNVISKGEPMSYCWMNKLLWYVQLKQTNELLVLAI